jgi:hypothetical protein
MNPPALLPTDDVVLQLLLRVARRADACVRGAAGDRASDRQAWLRAECEVFALLDQRAHATLVTER